MFSILSNLPITPPACVDGGFVVLFLLLLVLSPVALAYFIFFPVSFTIKTLAKGLFREKPVALYVSGLFMGVVSIGAIAYGLYQLDQAHIPESDLLPWFAGVILVGIAGWFVEFVKFCNTARNYRRPAQIKKVPASPKFQIWFQDLTVAILCLGTGLALGRSYANTCCFTTQEFLLLAFYLLIAGVVALLIAVDVCRRSETGHDAVKRAGIFASLFALFPFTLPAAIPAWWMWRRALKAQT